MDSHSTESESTPGQPTLSRIQQTKEMHIELVRQLMLKKVTRAEDIKNHLEMMDPKIILTLRTIYRYKGIIKRRLMNQIKSDGAVGKPVSELLYEMRQTYDEVVKQLWRVYHSTTSGPAAKVSALKEIRAATDTRIMVLQKLGLVHEEPNKLEVSTPDGQLIEVGDKNKINANFVAFVKAQFQDPIGATGSTETVARE